MAHCSRVFVWIRVNRIRLTLIRMKNCPLMNVGRILSLKLRWSSDRGYQDLSVTMSHWAYPCIFWSVCLLICAGVVWCTKKSFNLLILDIFTQNLEILIRTNKVSMCFSPLKGKLGKIYACSNRIAFNWGWIAQQLLRLLAFPFSRLLHCPPTWFGVSFSTFFFESGLFYCWAHSHKWKDDYDRTIILFASSINSNLLPALDHQTYFFFCLTALIFFILNIITCRRSVRRS